MNQILLFQLKTISFLNIFIFGTFMSICTDVNSQEQSVPVWSGVEIVTNDRHAYAKARKTAIIHAGDRISWSDAILPKNCIKIRTALRNYDIRCTAVVSSGNEATYVVEIVTGHNPSFHRELKCKSTARISKELTFFANKHLISLEENLKKSRDTSSEYVNEFGKIDHVGADSHHLDLLTGSAVQGKFAELKQGSRSCKPADRANAVYLMNYSGLPKQSLDAAIELLNDPDPNVRNISSRLVASFSEYLPSKRYPEMLRHACEKISIESFLDRNKGLSMILSILQRDSAARDFLPPPCRLRITTLAAESISPQVGDLARLIEKIAAPGGH